MNKDRSPSATPTARTTPLPDPSSPARRVVRSPLNPLGGSPKLLKSLLTSSPPKNAPPSYAVQAQNDGQMEPSEVLKPLSMIGADLAISLPDIQGAEERMDSTFRTRSRSRSSSRARPAEQQALKPQEMSESKLATSWWGPDLHVPRPWQNEPRRHKTIPPEHAEVLEETRKVCDISLKSGVVELEGG